MPTSLAVDVLGPVETYRGQRRGAAPAIVVPILTDSRTATRVYLAVSLTSMVLACVLLTLGGFWMGA